MDGPLGGHGATRLCAMQANEIRDASLLPVQPRKKHPPQQQILSVPLSVLVRYPIRIDKEKMMITLDTGVIHPIISGLSDQRMMRISVISL